MKIQLTRKVLPGGLSGAAEVTEVIEHPDDQPLPEGAVPVPDAPQEAS